MASFHTVAGMNSFLYKKELVKLDHQKKILQLMLKTVQQEINKLEVEQLHFNSQIVDNDDDVNMSDTQSEPELKPLAELIQEVDDSQLVNTRMLQLTTSKGIGNEEEEDSDN